MMVHAVKRKGGTRVLRANYHTHTTLCDGKNTPAEMAEAAWRLGFEQLGFSGHMDPSYHMDFPAYLAEVARLRAEYAGRMDILAGVELDQRWSAESVDGAEYIIGSTHFLTGADGENAAIDWSFDRSEKLCREVYGGDWYRMCAAYFEEEAQVYDRTGCHIVGHFDLITRFNHEHPAFDEADRRYLKPALAAMEYLAGIGCLFEINCGAYNRGRRRDVYPSLPLLKALNSFGASVVIGSDAHEAALLNGGFDEAMHRALACGFTTVCLLAHDEDGQVVCRRVPLRDCL